jgi:DNA-binding NarL/FixJ family response regulator
MACMLSCRIFELHSDRMWLIFVCMDAGSTSLLRIVVVDDSEEVRHLVSSLLHRNHGWELVGEAGDGMAAVELVNELHPDIVIMDVNMPRLDGIEATKQITTSVPQSKVIGFSTSTDVATRTAMQEAGSAAFVSKVEVLNLPHVIEQYVPSALRAPYVIR